METFDIIKFRVNGTTHPVPESEILAAEKSLRCKFPDEYRRFVQKYGPGIFRPLPVQVFSPQQILRFTPENRQRLEEYWFWDESPEILTKEDALRSIACFDTDIGHDIRFLPEDPSTFFVLWHEEETIARCDGFAGIVRLLDPDYESQVYDFKALNV
jgi:hypothetical protein